MVETISLFIILLLSTFFYFLISNRFIKNSLIKKRMEDYVPVVKIESEDAGPKEKGIAIKQFISKVSKAFQGLDFNKKTEELLLQAGSSLRLEEYFAYRIISASIFTFLSMVTHMQVSISILAMFIGFLIPSLYLKYRRRKRLQQLPLQLIDTLGMISNSMRAGFSFLQAMQLAGKEMPSPIGPEFERVVREIGLGVSFEKAFEDLLKRLPSRELEVVLQAIIAQRKSGGNLAALLDTMEETIRGRVRVLGELKTLTAQGKMSSWVITLLPFGLGLYLYMVSPEYFGPMITHPLGISMIVVAITCTIVGWFLIQKIVKIEV